MALFSKDGFLAMSIKAKTAIHRQMVSEEMSQESELTDTISSQRTSCPSQQWSSGHLNPLFQDYMAKPRKTI